MVDSSIAPPPSSVTPVFLLDEVIITSGDPEEAVTREIDGNIVCSFGARVPTHPYPVTGRPAIPPYLISNPEVKSKIQVERIVPAAIQDPDVDVVMETPISSSSSRTIIMESAASPSIRTDLMKREAFQVKTKSSDTITPPRTPSTEPVPKPSASGTAMTSLDASSTAVAPSMLSDVTTTKYPKRI